MKYLKYILGIIVVLLLIVLIRGFLTPSISYDSQITVNKSIEESWAVMNDASKIDQWLKGITKMEHVSGTKGAVGAVTNYTFNDNGQESLITETITAISPNEYVTMDFVMEGVMDMNYRMDFSESGGSTTVKSSTTVKGIGILMQSMIPFMKGTMQEQEDENMNNLKVVINNNTTDYFPKPEVQESEEKDEEAVE